MNLNWIVQEADFVALLLAIVTLLGSAIQYFSIKRAEEKKRRFETYHDLIRQLVERDEPNRPKMLDRQLAVAFELRNFLEYSEPSLRILKGLRASWEDSEHGPDDKRKRLLDQIDSTIYFLEVRQKSVLHPEP
ncbi:MAG: hypothetical protein K9G43_01765 [Rhodobacteraceae bacterium]|nr:hypothetical protein [Paracoccaceae bacterium]